MPTALEIIQGSKKSVPTGQNNQSTVTALSIIQNFKPAASASSVSPVAKTVSISPIEKARQSLMATAEQTVRSIADFTFKLVTPKLKSPVPQSVINNQMPSQPKLISINSGQTKLSMDQLAQIFPQTASGIKQLTADPLSLKANPKKAITDAWNAIKEPAIEELKRTYLDMAPSKTLPEKISKKTLRLTGAVNVMLSPINALFSAAEDIPVVASLAKVLALPFVAIGEGAPKVSNKMIDQLPIPETVKKELKPAVAEVFTLAAQIALGKVFEVSGKKAKTVIGKVGSDVFEKVTKNIIEESGISRTVQFSPKDIHDINLGKSVYEANLVKEMGLSGDQWREAIKKGLTIEVPAEKITRIVDKPYWEKVKKFFGQKTTDKIVETKGQNIIKTQLAGLLTDGEKTPQEIIDTVMSNQLEKTPEGKEILKTALDAKTRDQNVLIEKKTIPKELEPLAEEARRYKNAEEFMQAQLEKTRQSWTDPYFKKQTQMSMDRWGIKPDKDGFVSLYRGTGKGDLTRSIKANAYMTNNKSIASKYGKVQEIKVKPEDIIPSADFNEGAVFINHSPLKPIGDNKFVFDNTVDVNKPMGGIGLPPDVIPYNFYEQAKKEQPLAPVLDQKLAEINEKRATIPESTLNKGEVTDADRSLLTSEQVKELESAGSEFIKQTKEKLSKLVENVELRRQENEQKKSILDQFTGQQIKAMRTIKRSMNILANKGLGTEKVMSTKSYQDHIWDVMSAIGTDSETEALRYIQEDLPDPIITANTAEDLKKIKVLSSHLETKNLPGSELRSEQKPVGEGKVRESKAYSRIKERISEEFRENVSYNISNRDAQAQMAIDFIENNPKNALRVAFGLEAPPIGLLDRAVNIALSERALMEGNSELYEQLESSGSLRQTRRGQEINYDRGRFNDDSAHRYIAEVMDRRLKLLGKTVKSEIVEQFTKLSEAKKRAVEKIDRKVAELSDRLKKRDKSKINMAQDIIDQLTCK